MLTTIHKRSPHYKHPLLSAAYQIYQGKRVVNWSHGTQNVLRTKPFLKMANFLWEPSQGTYYDILVTTYQKIEGEGKVS